MQCAGTARHATCLDDASAPPKLLGKLPLPPAGPPATWPPGTSAQHEGYPFSATQAPAQCTLQVRH